MLLRSGRFGQFLGCSRFPECKGSKSLAPTTGITCPQCEQGEIVAKRTKRGKTFYGCNRYPECEFAVWQRPVQEPCTECGGLVVATAKGTKCTVCGHTEAAEGGTAEAG